jgi:lysophospholipase L1-like esterase
MMATSLPAITSSGTRTEPPMNFRLTCFLSGALLTSSLQAAEHFWDEVPLTPSTTVPGKVLDDYWDNQFRRVNQEVAAAQDVRLVFFGDSITWCWSLGNATGRQVWEDQFAAYNPINMGNSGDITPVMLYRVTHGNLDFPEGRQPRVAVLLCGINNFGVTQSAGGKEKWDLGIDCPPEDIAGGQRAIAQAFRRKLPTTRVIMMALLPVANPAKWERCQRVNAINAALARDSSEVAYVNLQDHFLQSDGTINRELYTDGIHLSAQGYRVWAEGITPLIGEFMKAPPLRPTKIMVIGGSITEAPDSSRCYRRYLDGLLRRSGRLLDFVGSRQRHEDDKTEPDSYQFDPDHEGYWGKDSAWFAEQMPSLLNRTVPDVAVIALGTEDIASSAAPTSAAASKLLAAGIARNINQVIKALRSKNPKVRIVVTKALATQGKEAATARFNKELLKLAGVYKGTESPVAVAETDRGLDRRLDLGDDGIIPTAAGARKIAGALAEAINTVSPLAGPARRSGRELPGTQSRFN